ncbi:DEHA2D04554p [Debaryomyces hansenii CBS767]|uniref:DEHA2D04554p n=1 Tax=Debaryomyces hansenii (strain ATCC 36239 / CBS 767 / BCRC 21394 / JCM 1990 / NBRC 0083 / IGC 2968) TaxID=284592 RepID=Q6BT06_DEBHA|nr:DEHA2D04554p [Debaryomyces hansenii CBS767]CAG86803.1 DEHA2D04554p [Debaryomyces hansenii CBS767]|eukprot:XP_458664.1 DEHA2D04554p [Debaryomyces hansenii CBS767]
MVNVFNVQIFFIVFRETLEAVVVVSVLLAFLKQGLGGATNDPAVYKKLVRQVWVGALLGLLICLILGGAFIGTFYSLGKDIWGNSEDLWEGIFCIIATVLISMMGIAMLRVNKMKEKWRVKLAQALIKEPPKGKDRFRIGYLTKKYCMFILPFITTLREGLEAVVFVGGVGLDSPASSFPLPVVCGLIAGLFVGTLLYYFGSTVSLQVFLIISTGILYLIAAGLFSRGVWFFETNTYNKATGGDASENGSGPGTYDISKSVWHVNCCNPETDNGWDVFNALLGWQNSATYGSVISYNIYWIAVIVTLLLMMYEEKTGHLPFLKNVTLVKLNPMYHIKNKKKHELTKEQQEELFEKVRNQRIVADGESNESSMLSNKEAINAVEK